jgi:hypothetical protein
VQQVAQHQEEVQVEAGVQGPALTRWAACYLPCCPTSWFTPTCWQRLDGWRRRWPTAR